MRGKDGKPDLDMFSPCGRGKHNNGLGGSARKGTGHLAAILEVWGAGGHRPPFSKLDGRSCCENPTTCGKDKRLAGTHRTGRCLRLKETDLGGQMIPRLFSGQKGACQTRRASGQGVGCGHGNVFMSVHWASACCWRRVPLQQLPAQHCRGYLLKTTTAMEDIRT